MTGGSYDFLCVDDFLQTDAPINRGNSGGPMFDMGPYYVTALVSLLGPVSRVTGSAGISFPERTITSNPLRGTAGYSPDLDWRRPGTATASGGPQSGAEDQPTIEDANVVLERLADGEIRKNPGITRAAAVTRAAYDPKFSEALRKERARKYGA